MSIEATAGLDGVSQSELELDSHIKFIDGMNSSDIQDALIKLKSIFEMGLISKEEYDEKRKEYIAKL